MNLEQSLRTDYNSRIDEHRMITYIDPKGAVIVEIHGFAGGTCTIKGRVEGDTLIRQE
jgi:hypothetical protein